MKKADSIECLVRNNEKCNIEKDRIGETDTLFLRRSLSENLPLFLPGEVSNTPPNLRKNKSLKSRLSLRLRSLRDRHLLPHKTHFSDAIQHKTQQQSVDRLDTENSLQSGDLGSGEIFKKKRRLTKKFLLGGIKWARSKTVDDNLLTIATQISSVVENCSTVKVDNSQFDVNNRLLKKPAPIEPKQKLLITISGRKTEFKNQISGKNIESSSGDPSSQSRELYKIQRERITPTTERGAIFQYQEFNRNLTFTVASTEQSLPEFSCQERGAVRKVSRSTRLERQTSQEEFFEDKLHFPPRDLSQERGSRFPRPLPYTVQQKTTKDERISRVQDYLNETLAQSNSSGPKATENDKIINKEADISSLNDSQKVKNSSLFHLVSSNDSDDSRSSDAARRRIKYVGQPTLYTDEEKDILEGKRDAFKNLEGISEYSFESDFPSEAQMPAFSGQLTYPEEAQIMTSAVEKREHLYKILVIGELGTGKTSFIKRYVHQFFSANYRATIGVDFALKVLHWDQNTIVRLQLWDIAGQERFGNMTRVYYKEAVGAFIVFDVTRSGTFDAVNKWKEDLDSKVQLPGGGSIPCILLANKCDQDKQGIVTNPEEMDEYVKENGFSGWYETSAKENINIEEAARALVSQILLNDKLITATDIMDTDKFALASASEQPGTTNTKKNCAC